MRFNKQVSVFLVCLMIAVVFWILLSLSNNYPASITFPVSFKHLPKKKVVVNELPQSITLNLSTSGFSILSYYLIGKKDSISIDVSSAMRSSGPFSDALAIPTRKFLPDFKRQLGEDVEITGFSPDTVLLMFMDQVSKRVPVRPDLSFSLVPQFDTVKAPFTIPDSVTISGPPSAIRKIRSIKTVPLVLNGVNASVDQHIAMQQLPLVEVEPATVHLHLPVEKFTEGQQTVDIHPMDVPDGYTLRTFPDKVRIRYQVGLSNYSSITSDQFDVVVNAGMLPNARLNFLPLKLVSKPGTIRSVLMEPMEVEYMLKKK